MSIRERFMMGCGDLDEWCDLFISDNSLKHFLNQEICIEDIVNVLSSEEGSNAAETSPKYDNCIGIYSRETGDFLVLRLCINEYSSGFFLKLVYCMKMHEGNLHREEMPVFTV